jgi:type II secretory ATPase GspE/PulE/Tfp pilus assembly ATPase PilB-like protein
MMRRLNLSEMPPEVDAVALVDQILLAATARGASDVHIEPTALGAEVRLRIDGLLETHSQYSDDVGRCLVTRLMVMAQLLTYRLDIPQEGRLRISAGDAGSFDLRLAVMPTTHGLRAAVRMPAELIQPRSLDELGLPSSALAGLKRFANSDSGMLIVTGPAGSGKTTTIYALLAHIARMSPGLSLVALEDPVERDIAGVTQIEISPFGQLTYQRALRSILRQDPQVLMLGEIRDAETASLAIQAALSGHRLICTLHAATPGGAVARLLEMGLESYRITSALHGVLAQRLVRRLNTNHAPQRYKGRVPVAEFVPMTPHLRAAILTGADANELQHVAAKEDDYSSLRDSADSLVAQHFTDHAEVERVLGTTNQL